MSDIAADSDLGIWPLMEGGYFSTTRTIASDIDKYREVFYITMFLNAKIIQKKYEYGALLE
jgi:hypothetical protein